MCFFFFQAEDGIRDLVRSRGLGDVYKRQVVSRDRQSAIENGSKIGIPLYQTNREQLHDFTRVILVRLCLLYTSDAADERSSVDLGGRRIIKKKKKRNNKKNERKKKNKIP